ncbi:MAG: MATE family efflux transporter [Clostridiales bacterium]|nr:MATE family efflux transporter [Clostridiales bacterium]
MQETKTFSRKYLFALIVPLIVEQILGVTVGMADMIMVSGAGETAVSGVSLVNTISNLLIYVFEALATGGAVVAAQALGAKKKKLGNVVANQLILVCFATAFVILVISLLLNKPILGLIYGKVEPAVMDNAVTYFYITAFSFPFLSVYYGSTALFRSMGNTKLSMYVSGIMNLINIIGNAVLIYGFHMGIAGVGIATLISRFIACIIVLIILRKEKYELHIDKHLRLGFSSKVIRKILRIGIPSGIDNGMFQIGKLFTQSLISSFGTASIAANATASTIELLATIPAAAMGLALTTVVGQCVGANDYDGAKKYTKRLLSYAYVMLMVLNTIILILAPVIASWYHLTVEGNRLAIQLIRYHSICCMIMWPAAWTLPATLRAAGDVKFIMVTSIISMWVFRIGLSYVIGGAMKVGVLGVWIAMTIDWAVRCILNIWRLKSGEWRKAAVI